MVGHDRRQQMYERMCLEHGVAGQVEFKGGSLDPSHWLRQAGALVLPTRYDPSANVVLESMACGVPPVTTATDGASEVVPMPWMIVDDPTDARAVARALRRALTEPGLGSRCREEAEKWTHHRSFSEFAQVLESACREVE